MPIEVPADLNREQIAQVTAQVQDEMDRLDALGDCLVQGDKSVEALIAQPIRRTVRKAA